MASAEVTVIATLKADARRYARPGAAPDGTVPGRWHGVVSQLPVISQEPGWLRVRLQSRPNGSTAWIRSTDAVLGATPYRITVNVAARRLQLFRGRTLVMTAPAGVGTPADPTPTGHFFVAFFEQAPSAGYGPFILVTSAHSDSIADWQGSGDAVIGIHGPLGEAIGPSGDALSHGCIRLPVQDLARLRGLPAGTPITITALSDDVATRKSGFRLRALDYSQ